MTQLSGWAAVRKLATFDPAAWAGAYVRLIRPFSPPAGRIVFNSVAMPYRWRLTDHLVPAAWRARALRVYGTHTELDLLEELGVVEAHRRFTRVGDRVTIIAGGHGVSTVHAARAVGPAGRVHVYEGGLESCAVIRSVVALNGVADRVDVHHAIVGEDIQTYGGATKGAIVPVAGIAPCDVLELDCQGAEVAILKGLDFAPRRIIVEVHPWLFEEPPTWVGDRLKAMGYVIDYRAGHNGVALDADDCDRLLERSRTRHPQKRIENGARYPVVISGSR